MFTYLLQSSCCIILFYVVYVIFYKPHTNHRYNRFFLLSAILLSTIIPWIEIITHVETIILIPQPNLSPSSNTPLASSFFTIPNILETLYLTGVLVSLSILFIKLVKLTYIIQKGVKRTMDGYTIVTVTKEMGICSFLNYIIVAQNNDELNAFELAHEKAHINQYHSYDIILAWIFQSIFWFNPMAYLIKLRLMEIHEFLADEDTIKQNSKSEYQDYILSILSQKIQPKLVHNFNSIIKTRLTMMNSKSNPSKWSYGVTLAMLFFTLFLFSCKTKAFPERSQAQLQPSQWVVETPDLNDPRRKWITETIIDTTIVIDLDTYEESISVKATEYQYTMDTIIVMDAETYEETISIVKTYKGTPPGFMGI